MSVVAMLGGAGLANCTSTSCTTEARAALVAAVFNASEKRVCDATVTVIDGAFSARLSPNFGSAVSCGYVGPYERAGNYSIVVRSGAKTARLDGVGVTADACHVRTRQVSITLDQ